MLTVLGDEPIAALPVAEDDEVLAEEAQAFLGSLLGELLGHGDGVPVAAQQLSCRSTAADARELVVFPLGQHVRLLTRLLARRLCCGLDLTYGLGASCSERNFVDDVRLVEHLIERHAARTAATT